MSASKCQMSINIPSKNHQWRSNETLNIQELAQKNHKWSLLFASKSSLFHQCSIKGASTKDHWSSNEISMFLRLAHLKQNISDQLISSRSRQCFINVPPTNHQWRSKDSSVFWRLAQKKRYWSIMFVSKSSVFHQCFLKKSSTTHHWGSN